MGLGVFADRPSCRDVCACLGRVVRRTGTAPKYIVCDRDSIFDCHAFRRWVKRKGIQPPRYGAVGKHGSIALIERLILTTKQMLRRLPLIPLRRQSLRRELVAIFDWYKRAPTPHRLGREDSQRGLSSVASRQSMPTRRTTKALATWITVRQAPDAGRRTARRSLRGVRQVPGWSTTPADRQPESRGISWKA